jgi:hypothetical protein
MTRKKLIKRKLDRFFHLSPGERRAFFEAACMLLFVRLAVLLLPFRWIAPRLTACVSGSPVKHGTKLDHQAALIGQSIDRAGYYMPWKSTCLVRAITGKFMLRRRRISNTLYLGVAWDEPHAMAAHAWLCCGNRIVTGAREKERFAVVAAFSEPK